MPRILGCLALLVVANTGPGMSADDPSPCQTAIAVGLGPLPGYLADVEVVVDGAVQCGRLIVTGNGVAHLEHLDEPTQRWARAVIHRASGPSHGWDNRTDPICCVWRRLGPGTVLAEVHTRDASLTISRHQPIPAR